MNILQNLSIRYKLRIIIVLTSGVVLLLASIAFISSDVKKFRQSMINEMLVLAKLAGRNSTAGLLFNDADATSMNLKALTAEQRILFTHIFNKQGHLFASYFAEQLDEKQRAMSLQPELRDYPLVQNQLNPQAQPQDIPDAGLSVFSDNALDTLIPLKFDDGSLIGAVYIRADTTPLHAELIDAAKIVLFILCIALVLAFALAASLESLLSRPVFHLLDNMQLVAKARDYSIRAEKMANDELGSLTDGFNNMLEQIEKSNAKLQQYQGHLEERVEKRTAELAESRDQALAANQALQQRSLELAEARDEALAANDALQKRGQELAIARDQAETANRAKSTFLANMSHELRTPLNGILGYTQILQHDASLNGEQKNGIDIIYRSGHYLLTLINDILDLSKIEAGRIELFPNDFLFSEFIRGLEEVFFIRAQEKGIAFRTRLGVDSQFEPRALPKALHADEKRLRQILLNLLSNAVKFTEKGQVCLRIGYQGEQIRFVVEDTGPGIAADDIDSIFAPFKQVGDVLHKSEGTGLGLAITKKLAEMMGGQLEVQSTLGVGTAFSFALHLPAVQNDTLQAPASSHSQQAKPLAYQQAEQAAPKKILVVDDNAVNRLLLRNMLQPIGFEVSFAENGEAALSQAEQNQPDLIVMDLIMPIMDGFTATQKLREHEQASLRQVPIIVASASAFEADKKRSFAIGATDFLSKPIEQKALLNSLQNLLKLQWIYAEESQDTADDSHLIGPSQEHAKTLHELTLLGDFRGLLDALEAMLQANPELKNFAQQIRYFSKEFDEEKILELLEDYLDA